MAEKDIIDLPQNIMLRGIIAFNLKSLRNKHEMTQLELADLTGINRVTIAKWETGDRSVSLINLLVIAKALNESPNALLEGWEKIF